MGFFREQRSRTPVHTPLAASVHIAHKERNGNTPPCTYSRIRTLVYVHFTPPSIAIPRAHSNLFPWRNSRRVGAPIVPFDRVVVEEQTRDELGERARAKRTAGAARELVFGVLEPRQVDSRNSRLSRREWSRLRSTVARGGKKKKILLSSLRHQGQLPREFPGFS